MACRIGQLQCSQLVNRWGPLPVADACEVISRVADGLAVAHAQGMIHRDVKPSNLMIQLPQYGSTGDAPMAKVLDLGLALLGDSQPPAARDAASRQVMGTLD